MHVAATRLAYIDEGWNAEQRILKFWFLADYISGEIDVGGNPADGEFIVEAGWFALDQLPEGHVFPEPLRTRFPRDLAAGFPGAVKLPLRKLLFQPMGTRMTPWLRDRMLAVCNRKIAEKGPEVGLSFYAFFSNRNDDPDLLMEAAEWWIRTHRLDHFEKAVKIRAMLGAPVPARPC